MASSYTNKLRFELPVTGELAGTWGNRVNISMTNLIEQAIAGRGAVVMTDADYTLTSLNGAVDEARNAVINITGTLTIARNVICPTVAKAYIVENATTGGFAITLKTAAGTGVSVPNGSTYTLRCDGTNVVAAFNGLGATLTANITGNVTGNVTGTTTSLAGGAAGTVVYQSATSVTAFLPVGTNGHYMRLVGGVPTWSAVSNAVQLDVVNVFTANQSVAGITLTSGATVDTDASLSNYFHLTLEHNVTLANPSNLTDGMSLTWRIKQGAGSYTLAYGGKFRFVASATAPVMTTAASSVAILSGTYNLADDVIDCHMIVRA